MSHLSLDRYCAVLGAEGVGLGRWHANQHQWLGSRAFTCDPAQPAWAPALEALGELLAEHAPRRAQLRVLLSARYSRFCLVPWSDAIGHPRELDAYARACFENLYGQPLDDWRIVLSPEPAGASRIATALPEALLQALQALGRESRLSLRSVQPYLMAAYNRCSAQLEEGDFLFVLAEPRRSVLLLAAGGAWQQVLAQGCADNDQALQALIERTCELYGEHLPRVYLHAPGRGDVPRLAAVQLCQPAGDSDPLCAMWRAVA
ncbi:Uncharacterised protein [Pseudomonas putida]|uniref:hypothetical protein n=1 Tax=Pseudomonas guariconensis TaxID=1288410 RepID=UPI0018D92743|nr:hypothetical protein [Pseudomonas guariconensis]CAB5519870.1 Uncharacterised protein [Pseudomonas putida]MCO7622225.1 hypothetical protein [Pseudomonas guariconensis]CAB5520709.1 Uncharacterised protein [Pseudomonas putida]CAB5538549.1 Uncharacterised protein [Pseudomonas putida]